MRLLTGPAGSGKTASLLAELREALRAGNYAVRLLAPTATLAQHLQNQLAREGFVFPRATIETLNSFVAGYTTDVPQVSDTARYLMVEAAAKRLARPEFARVAHLPGFSAALARTIAEFSSAGCDSARLEAHLPDTPLSAAFLAVYREFDRDLGLRGLATRARRLAFAAERITVGGLKGVHKIWLDGFHALPDPELQIIGALARHADVTLTLNDSDASGGLQPRLQAMGFKLERATRPRAFPAVALVKAAGIERETEEIARRILEQAAAGRPFREMGIIVRSADTYVPLLRTTLGRLGIPARFYFDSKLNEHPAVRFLSGALDALLGGWDHEATLGLMRLAPRLADSETMDRFDFEVRKKIPQSGLAKLKELAGDDASIVRLLDDLATLDEWRTLSSVPAVWAERFRWLRNLLRPARPQAATDHQLALLYRSQAAALDTFDAAVAETAAALEKQVKLSFEDFWRHAQAALRLTPLRVRDGRRNAVQVIGAHEARQWSLPVVFVCGMVEKQFPQFHRADPFFPDAARARLNAAGIRVRTAAEFEREERALFDAAVSRAKLLTTLSYPEFDARGERSLPSIFLDDLHLVAAEAPPVRPAARWSIATPARVALAAPALLAYLHGRSRRLSPSGLESYLQCAFQYFGGRMMKLKTAPELPAERLSFLEQGNLVHGVLAAGYVDPKTFEQLFETAFEAKCAELGIPNSYHTERKRNGMREDLLRFADDNVWPRQKFQNQTELQFTFPMAGDLEITGRIDRLDTDADGRAFVIDYKYSAAQGTKSRVKDDNLLQGPLYMMAAERAFGVKPDGVFYIGLKASVEYAGWSNSGILKSLPIPEDWLQTAERRTLQAMHEIRAGRVEAAPANAAKCRFCDFRDVCRVTVSAAAALAEGA